MTSKPQTVEIPPNATDQVVRIQLEEIAKVIRQARTGRKDRVRVTISSSSDQGK